MTTAPVDDAPLPAAVDSYYDEDIDLEVFQQITTRAAAVVLAMEPLRAAFANMARQLANIRLLPPVEPAELLAMKDAMLRLGSTADIYTTSKPDVRERALEARRSRNTGPTSRLGLDGHPR